MKKLSEYENEEALDLLADILQPTVDILSDPNIKQVVNTSKTKLEIAQYVIKNHKASILSILATMDGVPLSEYRCTLFTLPIKILELLSDKDLVDFFKSQGLIVETPSGSATENIEETEIK